MSEHDHHHDGHDHQGSALSDVELRVRALETVLTEKGYVDPAALDRIVEAYETRVGPHIGAAAVARAWVDPVFRAALLADASAAIAKTRFPYTTSSSARCAPATPGRCSACRPCGINPSPTAPAR
jgi:nitrile hydratase